MKTELKVEIGKDIEGRLAEYYSPKNILRHNAIELEGLAQDIMIHRLMEPSVAIKAPEECEEYIRALLV